MTEQPNMVNLSVLRTLVAELARKDEGRDDEFGSCTLSSEGLHLKLRCGQNGHAFEWNKILTFHDLSCLTVNGAKHVVKMMRDELFSQELDDND